MRVVWSTYLVSDASFSAMMKHGWSVGPKLGASAGAVHLVLLARRGRQNIAASTLNVATVAAAASVGALGLLLATPSSHPRTIVAASASPPECVAGAVFTECVANFGGGSQPHAATFSVRKRFRRQPWEPLEVEWEALAADDAEVVSRVRPLTDRAASGLLLDDGLGVTPLSWSASRISAPANTLPSGAFVALCGGSGLAAVLLGGSTSATHLAGGMQLSVHRRAMSDDGHGLGRHVEGSEGADLSDRRPGRLAFLLLTTKGSADSSGGGTPASAASAEKEEEVKERAATRALRELAARSSRPAMTLSLPRGCQRASWSALAAPMPSHVHVLGVSAPRPPGAPRNANATRCALWLRLQNLSPVAGTWVNARGSGGAMDSLGGEEINAGTVAAALSPGTVALHPTTILGGEIGYALWNRPCAPAV